MFDLIMFDLDGTLVDTAGEIGDTVNEVLRTLGLPPVDESQVRGWIGQGSRELLARACAHVTGLPLEEVHLSGTMESVMEMYTRFHQRRIGTRSAVYPGVAETLAGLTQRGVGLAVVSNREARFTEGVLRAHGLRAWFDPVVSGDTLPVRKPDARMIQHVLDLHRVAPQHALMVGDSAVDTHTARNAGVACWAVPYGYNGGIPIEQAGADRIIADLTAVLDAVRSATVHAATLPTPEETPTWR